MRTQAQIWRCVRKGPLSAINLPSLVPNLLGGHCDRGLEVCIHAPGASTHFADTCSDSHIKHTSADRRPFAINLYIIFLLPLLLLFSHAVDLHFEACCILLLSRFIACRMSHAIRDWISLMGMNSGVRNSITASQLSLNCCPQERSSIVQCFARFSVERDWNWRNKKFANGILFEYECVAFRDYFSNEKYAVWIL